MHILDKIHRALLDDPNNSIDYINALMHDLKSEIDQSYNDGYYDAQCDAGITIVKVVNKAIHHFKNKEPSNGS